MHAQNHSHPLFSGDAECNSMLTASTYQRQKNKKTLWEKKNHTESMVGRLRLGSVAQQPTQPHTDPSSSKTVGSAENHVKTVVQPSV